MMSRTRKQPTVPQPPQPVQAAMCGSCPFRTDGNQLRLAPHRLAEIQAYLLAGQPHECHHDAIEGRPERHIACRGGRDYQLELWHRMGLIPAPTDEALHTFLVGIGVWTDEKVEGEG